MSNVSDKSFIYRSYPKLAYGSIYLYYCVCNAQMVFFPSPFLLPYTKVTNSSINFQFVPNLISPLTKNKYSNKKFVHSSVVQFALLKFAQGAMYLY